MKYLVFALIGLALLFGCAAQKASPKEADSMEKPADSMPKPDAIENGTMEKNESVMENNTEAAPPPPAPPEPAEADIPVERFDISAENYAFTPSTITVKKGNRVRLEVTAVDRTYGFAIMDYGVNQLVPSGESIVVSFLAEKSGTFEIKNTHITSGAARDMKGTLIVE